MILQVDLNLALARAEDAELRVKTAEARACKAEATLDEALTGLEALGWPCRLVELPKLYAAESAKLDRVRGLLSANGAAKYEVVDSQALDKRFGYLRGANCWCLMLGDELVGCDGGEPEDQMLVRDWAWVPERLNAERAARLEAEAKLDRVRELLKAYGCECGGDPEWSDGSVCLPCRIAEVLQ